MAIGDDMTMIGKTAAADIKISGGTPPMDLNLDHDDRARAAFIIGLKKKTNFGVARTLEQRFREVIAPALEKQLGRPLDDHNRDDRKLAKAALEKEYLYQAWARLTYLGQDMMWNCVDTALVHELPRLQATATYYMDRADKLGSLTLDPALALPPNIAKTEIHRQPGGFCFERDDHDVTAGARYNGGGLMYSQGKGRNAVAGRSGGDFVVETVQARFPDFKPRRILEIGCGTGRNTTSYKRLFPDAEVVAIDCAAGLLRWAFAVSESEGTAIDFKQMDLTHLDFADGSFDLVVSHIVGHETTHRGLPLMLAESWRVLSPGGVMFHLDVPTQPGYLKLFDQVLNDWQVRYNGEPFWMGWADANVKGILHDIGVPDETAFAEQIRPPEGGNAWFCHGGRKPLATPVKRAA